MKANELMIGDWVQGDHCTTPSQVAGVTQGRIHTIWADGSKHSKDEYYFHPIPLTAEILEKNGFHYFPSATPHYYLESVDVLLNKEQGRCGYYTSILNHRIFINYIHELQHALRLCGLNDIADNFKI